MRLARFIENTRELNDPTALFQQLVDLAEGMGFPWVAYRSVAPFHRSPFATANYPAVLLDCPHDWQLHYFETGPQFLDPLLLASLHSDLAFHWADIYDNPTTSGAQQRVLDEAAASGLLNGVSVPIHGSSGSLAITSFATDRRQRASNDQTLQLQTAANHFHTKSLSALTKEGQASGDMALTRRERECLYWSAQGKTSWDTGTILGISENTVNYHIKRAMRKLNTGSRIMAVVKAIRFGWVVV